MSSFNQAFKQSMHEDALMVAWGLFFDIHLYFFAFFYPVFLFSCRNPLAILEILSSGRTRAGSVRTTDATSSRKTWWVSFSQNHLDFQIKPSLQYQYCNIVLITKYVGDSDTKVQNSNLHNSLNIISFATYTYMYKSTKIWPFPTSDVRSLSLIF